MRIEEQYINGQIIGNRKLVWPETFVKEKDYRSNMTKAGRQPPSYFQFSLAISEIDRQWCRGIYSTILQFQVK